MKNRLKDSAFAERHLERSLPAKVRRQRPSDLQTAGKHSLETMLEEYSIMDASGIRGGCLLTPTERAAVKKTISEILEELGRRK